MYLHVPALDNRRDNFAFTGYIPSNDRVVMNGTLVMAWKEFIVAL
jgi:hypothetical protein